MNTGVHRFFWIGDSGFLGYDPSSGRRLPVWFPVRAHAWVASQVPTWDHVRGNQSIYLSHIDDYSNFNKMVFLCLLKVSQQCHTTSMQYRDSDPLKLSDEETDKLCVSWTEVNDKARTARLHEGLWQNKPAPQQQCKENMVRQAWVPVPWLAFSVLYLQVTSPNLSLVLKWE